MNILEHIRFNVCVKETVPVTKIYIFFIPKLLLHTPQSIFAFSSNIEFLWRNLKSHLFGHSFSRRSNVNFRLFASSPLGHYCFLCKLFWDAHPRTWFSIPLLCRRLRMNLQSQTRSQIVPSDISAWMQDNQVQLMFGKNELLLFPANRSIHQIDINTDTLSYAR